jgi:hypothetical protein
MVDTKLTLFPGDTVEISVEAAPSVVSGGTATSAVTKSAISASATISVSSASSSTVTGGGTATSLSKPAATPVGTIVTKPGVPVYDGAGNAYSLISNPGQLLLTPFGGTAVTVTSSGEVIAIMVVEPTAANPNGMQQVNTSLAIWTIASTNVPGTYVGKASAAPVAFTPATTTSATSSTSTTSAPATSTSTTSVTSGATMAPAIPAASPIGTVVTQPGVPIYDGNGQAYEITPSGQLQLTPWQGTPFTVTSSNNVVSIQMEGVSASNPTGVTQTNKSGQVWTVAATNVAGTFVGQAASINSSTSSSTTVPAAPISTTATSLWLPPGISGDPKFYVGQSDWKNIRTSINGSNTEWSTTIPPGANRSLNAGVEAEYYCDPDTDPYDPFTFDSSGNLLITAKPASLAGFNNPAGQAYDSGCLTTAQLFSIPFGTFVLEVQGCEGPGWWPAGWLLNVLNGYAYVGEIDIFEQWQGATNYIQQTVHGPVGGTWESNYCRPNMSPDFGAGFHQIIADVREKFITFYADGQQTGQFPTPDYAQAGNNPWFLLLNLAVGTPNGWEGAPNAGAIGTSTYRQVGVWA